MSDKLLNLMGALQEENWDYNMDVLPVPDEDLDYVVTCTKYFDGESDRSSFDFNDFIELISEYQDVDVKSYFREEGPYNLDLDGVYRHVVEIQVKE